MLFHPHHRAAPSGPPPLTLPPAAPTEPEVHLLDRLGVIYRHRILIVSVLVLLVAGSLVHTYTTVPLYQAQARLLIEEERPPVAGLVDPNYYWQDPTLFFQTQYRVLRSRELARRVVRRVNLGSIPEFSGRGRQPSGVGPTLAALGRAIRDSVTSLWRRQAAPAEREPPARDETPDERALVDALLGRIQVNPVPNSRLVDVVVQAADPKVAALLANAIAEEYVALNLEIKLQNTQKTLDWLEGELAKARAKVEESERKLAEYREAQNALSLEERQDTVVARLQQLNDAVTRAKMTRVQKETLYNQLKDLDPDSPAADTHPAILQNGVIQQIKGQLAELRQRKAELSNRYGPKHPEMQKIDRSIAEATERLRSETQKIIDSLRNEYLSAAAEESRLAAALKEQERAAMDLNRKRIDYGVLEREAQSNRQVYEALLQKQKELQVVSSSKENNVRLMDRAEIPGAPFTPNPRRNLLIAIALGLVLGLGLAFTLDYLDDTVKTPEDITRRLRIPFLGLIPAVRGETVPVLSGSAPHDFGEAYRALRTSLVFTSGDQPSRIIVITSAQPLEGKTTTACNLAIVLALGGARVLLVDADMRRPGVHRVLGLPNALGLSHLLVGQAKMREVVQRASEPNLYVVTAGRVPPNPSELLGSERMKQLLANLATGPFDWVILDTPPVLAVTDAVILTPLASGVVFVFGAEMTSRRLAERAIEMVAASKPKVLGAVLNRVNFERNKYYYSRYYGYQYKSYYQHASARA